MWIMQANEALILDSVPLTGAIMTFLWYNSDDILIQKHLHNAKRISHEFCLMQAAI